MSEQPSQKIWIIRVGTGKVKNNRNEDIYFYENENPIWSFEKKCIKTIKKMKKGDILYFLTSKSSDDGAKIIAMAEYTEFYNAEKEPILQINTKTDNELGYTGINIRGRKTNWPIQVNYRNLYIIPKTTKLVDNINIDGCKHINIINYDDDYAGKQDKFKGKKIKDILRSDNGQDLYYHYEKFKYYSEPKFPA